MGSSTKQARRFEGVAIERGVPVPSHHSTTTGISNLLRQLEVGESFHTDHHKPNAVRNQMQFVGGMTGRKFISRTVEGGLRVWRIT